MVIIGFSSQAEKTRRMRANSTGLKAEKPVYGFSGYSTISSNLQDHYMLLEAYNSKKGLCITAKLMGMR